VLVQGMKPYINQAFGNETRVDYGTGHELSIMMFFFCLFKLDVISKKDLPAVVLRGFYNYHA
jgi:serine/threonine-protein phosphatase 2A activator